MSTWDSFWGLCIPVYVSLGMGLVVGLFLFMLAEMVREALTR